jgi:hypothetical protein
VVDLKEFSRWPRTFPRQTSPEVEERVLKLRDEYGWGARKLQVWLSRILKRRRPDAGAG